MQDPANRAPTEGEPMLTEDDPYADLESVFNEPIVLEEADLQGFEAQGVDTSVSEAPVSESEPGAPAESTAPRPGISESGLLARLEALEGEVRAGSERTLEALRRLGERVGTELAMLDKRAINLELTIARLRSVLEGSSPSARKPAEPTSEATPEAETPEA